MSLERVPVGRVAGIVLAGGQSSRMGQDKALLEWQGQSLIDGARTLLAEAGCSRIHVSGRADLSDGFADREAGCGPAAAMIDGLDRIDGDADVCVFIPVDMPRLAATDLESLIVRATNRPVVWQDQPLPAAIPLHVPRPGRNDYRSVRGLLRHLGAEYLPRLDGQDGRFANINTPGDFARLTGLG